MGNCHPVGNTADLEDALEECQVDLFVPQIGKNYRDYKEKDLNISFENTKDKSKAWEIFEIIDEGCLYIQPMIKFF